MSFEEYEPPHLTKQGASLGALGAQDLSNLSQEELFERISVLKQEIERTQNALDIKQHGRKQADSLFSFGAKP